MTWNTAKTGNHQGLVVDEANGASIAVCYDSKHAPIIAAAPDLLELLERYVEADSERDELYKSARAAIAKATAND